MTTDARRTKPPLARLAGVGTVAKKLLIALAVVATIAWIMGLVRLLAPEV